MAIEVDLRSVQNSNWPNADCKKPAETDSEIDLKAVFHYSPFPCVGEEVIVFMPVTPV